MASTWQAATGGWSLSLLAATGMWRYETSGNGVARFGPRRERCGCSSLAGEFLDASGRNRPGPGWLAGGEMTCLLGMIPISGAK